MAARFCSCKSTNPDRALRSLQGHNLPTWWVINVCSVASVVQRAVLQSELSRHCQRPTTSLSIYLSLSLAMLLKLQLSYLFGNSGFNLAGNKCVQLGPVLHSAQCCKVH